MTKGGSISNISCKECNTRDTISNKRVQVYKKAKRKFDNIIEKDRKGECPMYRSKSWERGRRDREKAEKKKTWYAKGGYETVLFVDSTPNSELAKQCHKALREAELKIRVVERAGQSIKQALVRSNPLNENSCKQDDCKTCQLNPKANCKSRDSVQNNLRWITRGALRRIVCRRVISKLRRKNQRTHARI